LTEWAQKIFPDQTEEEAVESLWDRIFAATRMHETDPIAAWKAHLDDLQKRQDFLQKHDFEKLHFTSDKGTDLEILLPEGHVWTSGGSKNAKGEPFVANLPTEEVFSVDEGSRYLGEVALVPYHSPISDTGIIFYNTLFDENAACHLAFGEAYPTSLSGGEKMTEEELQEKGVNRSLSHVDFMIGDATLSITGITKDGKEVPVFEKGNWAFS
jgi:aminopeptidase